jgi:hypothetical protein
VQIQSAERVIQLKDMEIERLTTELAREIGRIKKQAGEIKGWRKAFREVLRIPTNVK